jgi:hypothetical protein
MDDDTGIKAVDEALHLPAMLCRLRMKNATAWSVISDLGMGAFTEKIDPLAVRYPDGSKRALPGSHHGLFYTLKEMFARDMYVVEGASDVVACRIV